MAAAPETPAVASILDRIKAKPAAKPKPERRETPERRASGDWRDGLIVKVKDDGSESILCRVHNLILILQNAPQFKGRIRFNEFSEENNIDGKDIDDVHSTIIMAQIERNHIQGVVNSSYVDRAISAVAKQNPFHPVRDYLNSLTWDGTPRVDYFFSDHFGCPHDEYHIGAARSLFISAVLRILNPGCQCDTMTVLQGIPGTKKSSVFAALFAPWYAECIDDLKNKDFFSGQRGIWCLDFGELAQFGSGSLERIKQIISMREDNYRNHYGRGHKKHPRQSILVGGTNRDDWQCDSTGGRKYLPIVVRQQINVESIAAIKDQLFAEAVVIARDPGEWWNIPGAEEHQDESYVGDSWEEVIAGYVLGRDSTTIAVLLADAIRIDIGKQTKSDQTRAGNCLRRMGWYGRKETVSGARVWVYRPARRGV